jgi:hypothetical protein
MMQQKTRNIVLLLLLALLFSARNLTAQTGWQFFTVKGTGGDLGMLSVQFNDAANNMYAATFMYDQADTPRTAAAALASILIANYGTNAFTVSPQDGTLAIAFTPYTIHTEGNGYFYNVASYPPQPISGQSMYIVSNGFDSPASATSGPSDPTYDTTTTTTQAADGSVTIGTNSPPVEPGTVSVVVQTFVGNPDGSLTLTTTYSDGTVTATTYGAINAAAAQDSNAAIAAAQGDTSAAAAEYAVAAVSTTTAYAAAAQADAAAAAQAAAQGDTQAANQYANASLAAADQATAIAGSVQNQATANPAAADATAIAQALAEAAQATQASNAATESALAALAAAYPSAPTDSGDSGCGASCGSGGDYDPCGDEDWD